MIKVGAINKISADIILKQLNSKIDNASAVLVNEVERVSGDYVPWRSGDLFRSVKQIKEGHRYIGLAYTMEYASYIWYGKDNWQYNTSTHPKASPRWCIRAFNIYKSDILKKVEKDLYE